MGIVLFDLVVFIIKYIERFFGRLGLGKWGFVYLIYFFKLGVNIYLVIIECLLLD